MAIGTCAAVLAGVIVASDESAPIPVRLDGFPIDWRWRSTDGTLPVRWNEKLFPWIEDESKIAELWKTRPIRSDPDWEGLALARSFDDPSPLSVKTCAEWAAGLDSGRGAMRTVDLIEQVEFIFADGILSMLAHAVPSARSTFTDIELVSLARELLPPPVDRDEIRRPDKPGLAWFIRGNRVHREDEDDWEWIEPVAFGDIDGDGWEDLVANSCEGSQLGSRFSCEVRAFTRRDEGELVEITPRVADRMPSSDERRRAVAGWRANYGLPVGSDHPIHLRGRCDCRDVDHPFEMYLTVQDGLLAGHYRCAHREKPLEIHGCLAESRGLIQEFGIDDRPTAFLRFDWRIVSGVLFLDGYRFGIGHQEIDNFKAEGVVTEASERMAYEGCASEVRFPVASGSMSIRRACGRSLGGPARDVLCVQEGETDVELVRFDRIEWISEERHPEEDPASDAELAAGMSRSVFRVDAGGTMALFEGWVYGGSTNNPKVIAIPIVDGRLSWHERRIFDHAVVVVTDGVARIHEQDLRAGVDPYVDSPQRPDVVHRWAGRSWEVEQ